MTERFPGLAHIAESDPLMVGLASPDDAAVYRLGGGRVLIATLDFFPPIVDDPFQYGQIAAANALSDVYAMGGDPFLALSVAAFPSDLPIEILTEIVSGAAATAREAGAVLAGGHTVRDAEPKFGLVALGFGSEERLILKSGARVGDRLFLTKPLGTGALSTALKDEALAPHHQAELIASMIRLNAGAARAAVAAGVRGGTDVTGFGLAGHALEMARGGGVQFEIDWPAVPILPGAREAIAGEWIPGGTAANDTSFAGEIAGADDLRDTERALLFDPQTSGGLLLAVPAAREAVFRAAASAERVDAVPIGVVRVGAGIALRS